MTKELFFSVTRNDCEWSYTRGTGAGGQKKNKTSSAVHCMHRPSGAAGYAEESRSQHENKILAFKKMANTDKFKKWLNLEIARRNGTALQIDEKVRVGMTLIKVEVKKDGKWVEVDRNDPLPDVE